MKNNDIRIRNLEIFSSNYEGEGIEKMLPKGFDKKVGEISEGGTGQKGGIMIIKPPPLEMLLPPDMTGHDSSVHTSATVPYTKVMRL